jgi:hypothetical protein
VRYTYLGFLEDAHHADAVVQVDIQGDLDSVVHGSVSTRTLAPGGDLLTLSTVAASPAITWARLADGLRPARGVHAEVGVDRNVASGSHFGALLFAERTNDALLTVFEGGVPLVSNFGTLDAAGFGITVGHRFGGVIDGSLTYTFGQGRRAGRPMFGRGAPDHRLREGRVPRSGGARRDLHRLVGYAARRVLPPERARRYGCDARERLATDVHLGAVRHPAHAGPAVPGAAHAGGLGGAGGRTQHVLRGVPGRLPGRARGSDPPTRVVGGISVKF